MCDAMELVSRVPSCARTTLYPLHPIPRPNLELDWTQSDTALPLINTLVYGYWQKVCTYTYTVADKC